MKKGIAMKQMDGVLISSPGACPINFTDIVFTVEGKFKGDIS